MRRTIAAFLAITALLAGGARAAGKPEAGSAHYATCAACHGAQGEGNAALKAPRLTHLAPVYMVAQLQKFKSGARGGAGASDSAVQMAGMAATLTDEQAMQDVASYIATLAGTASRATVEGDVELGVNYYNQFCGACHGAAAEGNLALNSPRLAGADDWYLVAQLQAFRSGPRGTHTDDRTGKQMRLMAAVLPDDEAIAAVIAYIHSIDQ